MRLHVLGFALLSATAIVGSVPAHAQNGTLTRSFVSSAGLDTNACTITAPCATFAEAYTKIGSNGIVAALDPGRYGPLTITGPVTINGNGWSAITAPAKGIGITINAVSGSVILTGLEIDGTDSAYNGIVFNSGDSLTVSNCVLVNFTTDVSADADTGNGILIQPASGVISFAVTNSTVSNDLGSPTNSGIAYEPPSGSPNAIGVIDHVVVINTATGILAGTGLTSGSTAIIAISNSIVSNSDANGISVSNGGPLTVSIDTTSIISNAGDYGIHVAGTSVVYLGRSVITGANVGVYNETSPNTFYTYGDNRMYGNGADGFSSLNTMTTTH